MTEKHICAECGKELPKGDMEEIFDSIYQLREGISTTSFCDEKCSNKYFHRKENLK